MKHLFNPILRLSKLSESCVNQFGAQYDTFSVFVFVFYLANPLKWYFSELYSFTVIANLRLVAIAVWLLLALWRYWPKSLKKFLPLFWHFALLYHLPFRTTFSLLNSSHSPSFDSFALMGIVAMAVLVDEKVFLVLSSLGIMLGSIVFFAFGKNEIPLTKIPALLYAASMVVAIAYMKLIFFRNYSLRLAEKNRTYKILAGAIAHEVRGPMSTISIASENLETTNSPFDPKILSLIKRQVKKALSVIDSILLQVKYIENSTNAENSELQLSDCIKSAINDPYFSDDERCRIQINMNEDPKVIADRLLLIQIFTNLIKNSLWAIKSKGGGELAITTERINNTINIHFFDDGIGISLEDQQKLFEPFVSKSKLGAGLGLAFCKLATQNMGGNIKCESKEGYYTRFTIELRVTD